MKDQIGKLSNLNWQTFKVNQNDRLKILSKIMIITSTIYKEENVSNIVIRNLISITFKRTTELFENLTILSATIQQNGIIF